MIATASAFEMFSRPQPESESRPTAQLGQPFEAFGSSAVRSSSVDT